jgi:hypothetical protein
MSDQDPLEFASPSGRELPDPAREALGKPHLTAEQLKQEIGDSEAWDEASGDRDSEIPAVKGDPVDSD